SLAWRRPTSVRGTSVRPVWRPAALHSVSPCRTSTTCCPSTRALQRKQAESGDRRFGGMVAPGKRRRHRTGQDQRAARDHTRADALSEKDGRERRGGEWFGGRDDRRADRAQLSQASKQ